jgi:uncharacterized protein (TIGR02996 family)
MNFYPAKHSHPAQSYEERALIRAIVADPDSNAPRRVYADWLDEHGRPERAEFIRLQCNLQEMHAREQELIERNGDRWISEAYGGTMRATFHRGFPEEGTLRIADFIQNHAQINNHTPLSHLHFYGPIAGSRDADLATFARLPALRQVRSLELMRTPDVEADEFDCGPEGLRALADSPYLQSLQKLSVHSRRIGPEGAMVIAGSPTFQNLTHLTLSNPQLARLPQSQFDDASLVLSPYLNQLKELQLGDRMIGSAELRLRRAATLGPRIGPNR